MGSHDCCMGCPLERSGVCHETFGQIEFPPCASRPSVDSPADNNRETAALEMYAKYTSWRVWNPGGLPFDKWCEERLNTEDSTAHSG